MGMALPPPDSCPYCKSPLVVTNQRDGITFYACRRCTAGVAYASSSAESARRLKKQTEALIERANQRIREATELIRRRWR